MYKKFQHWGAFTIKGTKDYIYMLKILHPRDFEK